MDGAGNGRKKLKHRLAAILSVFSRRSGGRKRRDDAAAPPPLALPSYARVGAGGNGKKVGGQHDRRLSVSARRAVPLIRITIDCAGRRSVDAADPSLLAPLDANAKNMETSEWEGRQCPPSSPFPVAPLPPLPKWTKDRAGTTTRRLSTHSSRSRLLMSSSSSDDEYDEQSSRNLFSSRSFSSDSSDFYNCPRNKTTTRARASVSGPPCRAPASSARRGASQSCRYSFELPRGSTASDGGFAVVKRSADPYEDFRRSMEEMIAGWPEGGHGIQGEEQDAEGLLETYLVLNSPRHYPAILAAFADVRETLCP